MSSKSAQKKGWFRSRRGWKNIQQDTKLRKKTRLALIVLLTVFLVVILSKAVQLVNKYSRPLTFEKQLKSYIWDGKSNINLVIHSKQISLLNFNPVDKRVTVINIPDDAYIKVSDKFGAWRVDSIYGLGQSEKPPQGNIFLINSIYSMLALPIDGLIYFKGGMEILDLISSIKQNPFSVLYSINDVETNLTPLELFKLYKGLLSVRFDKVNMIDLKEAKLVDETRLADNSIVYEVDPIKLDSAAFNFYENQIVEEQLTIAIYNATDYPGLAQKATRVVKNIGGNVIISSNASQKLPNSIVLLKNAELKNSFTGKKLNQIFSLNCSDSSKCDKTSHDSLKLEEFRADINIILGGDINLQF